MKKQILSTFIFAFAAWSASALTYSVTVPSDTKSCYISGEMNGWEFLEMTRVNDTHFKIDIPYATTEQKYKYCSGPGWGYVEKDAKGDEIENRSYMVYDVVSKWAAVYNKNIPDSKLVYTVTVPKGTKVCYVLGGWDGWKSFTEMRKTDATHFSASILSNKALKYNYFAGPGWGYVELDADKRKANVNRSYSKNDVVSAWAAIYDKSIPDAQIQYNVTVPLGTNRCYIAGGWDGWLSFIEMKKVDARHFTTNLRSNKALKYRYFSGPGWQFVELLPKNNQSKVRSYGPQDVVLGWNSVWEEEK